MSTSIENQLVINRKTARRLILACQGLYPPRDLKGKEGVLSFLDHVRSIQYDPINVVGRNPDLVLQARVKDYHPRMLDELLYEDRLLIDSWDKMASLSLVEDWPFFTRYREKMTDRFGKPSDVVMAHAQKVLDQIQREGPQSSLDFHQHEKTDWAWGPTRISRAVLEGLYKMGRLGIHHRVNNRRHYDLIEKLLPADFLNAPDPNPDLEKYQSWHVTRRIGSLGLAHINAGEHWGGILGVKSPERRKIISRGVEAGELFQVILEDLPGEQFFLRKEDLKILDQVRNSKMPKEAAFIAPLDNLLWDRKTLNRLFEFRYKWEVYTPEKKREFGYYVLPVLFGDRFIARIDPGFDKKTRILTIKNWWWESGINPEQDMIEALVRCMKDFQIYLGAQEIKYSARLLKKGNLDWLERATLINP
jgi:uncharacterized protein YcaQ